MSVRPARRSENRRKDAEEVVIPVALARGDLGMMIFDKPPNLAERDEVVNLRWGELGQRDARRLIELMIKIEWSLGGAFFWRCHYRFAIHEQAQIVDPRCRPRASIARRIRSLPEFG